MPIEIRNDVSGMIAGPIATQFGAAQKHERDREYASKVAIANAELVQRRQQLQLQALDAFRDDELRYLDMMLGNQRYYSGENQRSREFDTTEARLNRQFDQTGLRADRQFDENNRVRLLDMDRTDRRFYTTENRLGSQFDRTEGRLDRQFDVTENRANREFVQRQHEAQRMERTIEAQRERDLMSYRAEQGMSPVSWTQYDQQQLSNLQAAYQNTLTNPIMDSQERMQAAQLIQQRMQPLQQRQAQAQQFGQQQRMQQFEQNLQMRLRYHDVTTGQITNQPGPNRIPYVIGDDNRIQPFEPPMPAGGRTGSSTSTTNREIVPGVTNANLESIMDEVRGATDADGNAQFATPDAQNEEVVRRIQQRQQLQRQLTGGESPTLESTTGAIQGAIDRVQQIATMRGPAFEAYVRELGQGDVQRGLAAMGAPDQFHRTITQQTQDLQQLANFARLTNGFTSRTGLTRQQREQMAEVYQRIRQTNPQLAQEIGRAMMQSQSQPQQQQQPAPATQPQSGPARPMSDTERQLMRIQTINQLQQR